MRISTCILYIVLVIRWVTYGFAHCNGPIDQCVPGVRKGDRASTLAVSQYVRVPFSDPTISMSIIYDTYLILTVLYIY